MKAILEAIVSQMVGVDCITLTERQRMTGVNLSYARMFGESPIVRRIQINHIHSRQ